MTDLFTATRPYDLPPKWDGFTVNWDGWKTPKAFICPPPKNGACECGSTASSIENTGTVHITGLPRIGRRATANRRALFAFRCPDCLRDTVWDGDQWFDLDPDDYTDEGSWMR